MLTLGIFCFALWGCNHGLSVPHLIRTSLNDVETLLAKVGDKVELDCSAVDDPSTRIFWYKYNNPLLDITYRRLDKRLKSKRLVLDNLLYADSGNYSCHLNNTLGSINRTFILHVYESSNNHPMILKSLLTNTTAVLGSDASFHCHVTSNSVTYIRWYFKRYKAIQVNASSNSTHKEFTEMKSILPVKVSSFVDDGLNGYVFRGEAALSVQNVSFEDEGKYICEAFNERGKVRHSAFLMVVRGPTPSAHEIEARYASLFGQAQELPLAVLVAVPVAFLIILTAVFIRALERAKQKYGVGLGKKTDMNGEAVVTNEPRKSNKGSASQKTEKELVISDPRRTPYYIKHNGIHNTGQQTTPLTKKVTCEAVPCSCSRPQSSHDSDVSSKRCSAALELEWEGIELVMEDGFEMIKLCKEEEV